jgi:hypothetical protein
MAVAAYPGDLRRVRAPFRTSRQKFTQCYRHAADHRK